jgi:hypothetical protein
MLTHGFSISQLFHISLYYQFYTCKNSFFNFNNVFTPSDFDMSGAQQEHAFAIEHISPRLAALRIELCPIHMSEECFWKIYFVLLHPRLNKHDAELLSTPQVNCFTLLI